MADAPAVIATSPGGYPAAIAVKGAAKPLDPPVAHWTEIEPPDESHYPGDGLCHSFLNNTDAEVRLLAVGDTPWPENRIFHPRNPDRKPRREDWWHDHPEREMGGHDGLTDLWRAQKQR